MLHDNKVILKTFYIEQLGRVWGSMSLGSNTLEPFFTDMKLTIIIPPTEVRKKKSSKSGDAAPGGAEVPEGGEGEDSFEAEIIEKEEEETKDEKEKLMDYKCLKLTDIASRGIFCEEVFGGKNKNSDSCTTNFCEICCST